MKIKLFIYRVVNMKTKLLTTALFFIFCGVCWAEDINIQHIITIESSGNPNAYNKRSGAIGLMQITPIVLKEWNKEQDRRFMKYAVRPEFYNLGDLYNPKINIEIGEWYINERIPQILMAYHIKDTIETRLVCYNEGIGLYRKGIMTKETRNYIKKYLKLTKKAR